MKAKKILLVSHYFPPHHGGIEIVTFNQAKQLAELGHSVTVVSSKIAGDNSSEQGNDFKVLRIKAWNGLEKRHIPFPLFSPRLVPVLFREAKKADIVHIHDAFYISSFFAALAATLRKRPAVLTQHVSMVTHPSKITVKIQSLVYNTSGAFVFRRSSRILTLNDRVESFLLAHRINPKKISKLSNGVDTKLFHPPTPTEKQTARKMFNIPARAKVVLFVGRYVPKKGFNKVLASQSDDYLLVFAGGKTKLGNSKNVMILGQVPQQDMARIFHIADIYILPSEAEGFPLTIQEAMASGLPVIMKQDPGYARYNLDSENICLLEDSSPETIKKAVNALLADNHRRILMSDYSRKYALKHFSWTKIIKDLDTIYDEQLSISGAKS